ncbi:MAG: YdbH domain-containing protein, partial [Gammaproteobacteria bacterium]|nr:YdbH domain-containing protein [Gammaproteobacteria bacterium]
MLPSPDCDAATVSRYDLDPEINLKRFMWPVLALFVVVIIIAIVQLRRDSIAREIANQILSGTDFAVDSLSVRTLGVDHIELSSIVLANADGTRYEISGLNYPLTIKAGGTRRLAIERMVMTWPDDRPQSRSSVDTVRMMLGLAETLANTDVRVQRLSIPAIPELSGISWGTTGEKQHFRLDVAGLTFDAHVVRVAENRHSAEIVAIDADQQRAVNIWLAFVDYEAGFDVRGEAFLHVGLLEPLLRSVELLPESIDKLDMQIGGPIAVELDSAGIGSIALQYEPMTIESAAIVYRSDDDVSIELAYKTGIPFDIEFEYPSLNWTVDTKRLDGSMLLDDGNNLATAFHDVHCRSGIHCKLQADVTAKRTDWSGFQAAMLTGSFPLSVDIRDSTTIDVGSSAALALSDINDDGITATAIHVSGFSGTRLTITDAGWIATSKRLQLSVEDLRPAAGLHAALKLTLDDMVVDDSIDSIKSRFRSLPGQGKLSYDELEFVVPGAEGRFAKDGDIVSTSFRLVDAEESLQATVSVEYDNDKGRGTAKIRDGILYFGRKKLSERVLHWSRPWDAIAGRWYADADISWNSVGDETQYIGQTTHRIENLAGIYEDIGFAGLKTQVEIGIGPDAVLSVSPAEMAVALVDVGVPIENLSANVALDTASREARVGALSGAVLGGRFQVDPFTYAASAERNLMMVRPENVQLQFIVDLAEFEELKVTGTMSGMLPVSISEDAIRVENG